MNFSLSWDEFDTAEETAAPTAKPVTAEKTQTLQTYIADLPTVGTANEQLALARLKSLDLDKGSKELELGARRINAEDKRMINSTSDVNQLIPFKYPWAWEKYNNQLANNWLPTEVNMAKDIAQWKSDKDLSADERKIIMRSLGFFATADTVVANNLVLSIYRHITAPECRQFLLRQAFEEAMHSHSYQHCIQSMGMDEGEVYNMYREIPSVAAKAAWGLKHTEDICDPSFKTGTTENDQKFLRNLVAYYCVLEGMFFYCGFAQILSMGRRGIMTGTSEQFQYILRDESAHLNFGIDVINQIVHENPHLWTPEFKQEIRLLILEGMCLEIAYARDTMPTGILGMNANQMEVYLKFIANRRLVQLGMEEEFLNVKNPFMWMSEMMDLRKEKNFFESRVTEYQATGLDFS